MALPSRGPTQVPVTLPLQDLGQWPCPPCAPAGLLLGSDSCLCSCVGGDPALHSPPPLP